MRAYLIKDEGTFERLAMIKHQEDDNLSNKSGAEGGGYQGGRPTSNSSIGS